VTRVLSALVLLPVVIGTIVFLPPEGTLVLALVAAVLAFSEYRRIARALGIDIPGGIGAAAVVLAGYAMWSDGRPSDRVNISGALLEPNLVYLVMMAALIVVGALAIARGKPAPGALADAAGTLFAPIYLGLPLGALAAI